MMRFVRIRAARRKEVKENRRKDEIEQKRERNTIIL
jgi:hypothetical protein